DRRDRQLVPSGYHVRHVEGATAGQLVGPRLDVPHGDDHVVVGVQPERVFGERRSVHGVTPPSRHLMFRFGDGTAPARADELPSRLPYSEPSCWPWISSGAGHP